MYTAETHGISRDTNLRPLSRQGRGLASLSFIRHQLVLETSDGVVKTLQQVPRTVADFYRDFMSMLQSAGIAVKIWHMPVEIPNPISFDEDRVHAAYDSESVEKFWCILLSVDSVFHQFRSRFLGKSSPVHFFWGSFDLAVTRFSGRRAPDRPGADAMTREAYSHEVSSVGFWPGSGEIKEAAFYSYTQPEPQGLKQARVRPEAAFYSPQLGEFLLMYDDVRKAKSPSRFLLDFCQTTYEWAIVLSCVFVMRRELVLQTGIVMNWNGRRGRRRENRDRCRMRASQPDQNH